MKRIATLAIVLAIAAARASAQQAGPSTCGGSAPAADTVPCAGTAAGYLIVPTEQERGSARDVSDLLTGRAAGLYVRRTGGEVGAASRIYLRGPSHLAMPDRPMVIVDGVRAAAGAVAPGLYGYVIAVSPLDELDPQEVDSIRVLSGAAAAARYGPAAAAGALLVTTRRGAGRGFHATGFARIGAAEDAGSYPANYERIGTYAGGGRGPCPLVVQANGNCTPIADSLYAFNPLEQASPFRSGALWTAGARVDGGAGPVSYLAYAARGSERGVLRDNGATRTDLHGSLTLRLPMHLQVGAHAAYVERDLTGLPMLNTFYSTLTAGLLGSAHDDSLRGYAGPVAPFGTPGVSNTFDTRRARGAAWAAWSPAPWARVEARYGVDHGDRDGIAHLANSSFSSVDSVTSTQELREMSASAWVRARPLASVAWRSGAGVERTRERLHERQVTHASTGGFSASSSSLRRRVVGLWLSQGVDWRGTVQVDGVVRRDSYLNGGDPLWSGSASAAWTVSGESFFPRTGWLDELRLRGSWGRIDAFPYAEPDQGISAALFTIVCPVTGPCDFKLRPERNTELEAGVEGRLWRRVAFRVTGYRRETARLVNEGPSLSGPIAQNVGTVRNTGVEGTLRLEGLELGPTRWELAVIGATNRNRVTRLDLVANSGAQRVVEGYPLGGYWGRPIASFADTNGDGVLRICSAAPCEVVLDTLSFLGAAQPGRMLAAAAKVRLGTAVSVAARLEHQGAYLLEDRIGETRCGSSYLTCRAAVDPSVTLEEQAAVVARLQGSPVGFIHDASFTRVREVSVTLTAPPAWMRGLGAAVDLSLSGRNLGTWTSYPGLDPEVNAAGPIAFPSYEFGGLPLPRSWSARLDVRF